MANKVFDFLDRAAAKAMQQQNRLLQVPTDPHVARYEHLKPVDFQTIATTYGSDALVSYIQTMEARRIRGG